MEVANSAVDFHEFVCLWRFPHCLSNSKIAAYEELFFGVYVTIPRILNMDLLAIAILKNILKTN